LCPNLYVFVIVFLYEIHCLNRESLIRKSQTIFSFCISLKKQKFFIGCFELYLFSVDFYFVERHFVSINSDSIQKFVYRKTIFDISPNILFYGIYFERGKTLGKIYFRILLGKSEKRKRNYQKKKVFFHSSKRFFL